MAKEKIDQVLEEIKTINGRLGTLEQGQQRNYDLIQKNGLKLEQVASDVRGVAEGHGVLLNSVDGVKAEVRAVNDRLDVTNRVVGETNRMLKEHLRQPAHA
ncbi:MAG: hypothetical protein ABH823_05910 [bacterium]